MIIVLANEIADVDVAEFEKIGSFHEEVFAVPNIDVSLSIKGMRSSPIDSVEDCQNTLFLTYEAPCSDPDMEVELLEDPFVPGIIYHRAGRDFVELKYEQRLGALVLYVYFLIDVNDCTFGYQEEDETHVGVDYKFLWKKGLVRRVNS